MKGVDMTRPCESSLSFTVLYKSSSLWLRADIDRNLGLLQTQSQQLEICSTGFTTVMQLIKSSEFN